MISLAASRPFRVLQEEKVGQLLVIILAGALPLGLASSARTFDDGDVSWHIAAGRWVLEHGRVPAADPFSFTAAGHPWVATEWLAEIAYAAAYDAAGYAGLAAIVAGALIALHAILFFHLQRYLRPLGLAATFVALDIALSPFILARPHVLVWPIIAGWTVILLNAAEKRRAPPLAATLLMLAWTNLHASFPLGFVIAAAIAFDALREARWKTLPQWAAFGLASLVAGMLNANGLPGLIQPFRISGLEMLPFIEEWRASTPSASPQFYALLLLGLGALLWSGRRVPPGRLVLLLVMLAMAFTHMRHQSWFVIVAAAVAPPLFGAGRKTEGPSPLIWLAAIPLLVARALLPLTPPENAANPRSLVAAVPPDMRSQPVLNGYTFGGPLILAGIKPYIDGRAEIYGDAFVADYVQIIQGDRGRFDRAVQRYGIRWTMLPASSKRLIEELDSSGSWQRVYSDKVGVIHVRRD